MGEVSYLNSPLEKKRMKPDSLTRGYYLFIAIYQWFTRGDLL
jgi:hypothetical protein